MTLVSCQGPVSAGKSLGGCTRSALPFKVEAHGSEFGRESAGGRRRLGTIVRRGRSVGCSLRNRRQTKMTASASTPEKVAKVEVQKSCTFEELSSRFRAELEKASVPSVVADGEVSLFSGDFLSRQTYETLFRITKSNMQALYDDSAPYWSWSDDKKREEIRNGNMRYIIVSEPRSVSEVCKDVLGQIVSKVEQCAAEQLNTLSVVNEEQPDEKVLGFVGFTLSEQLNIRHVYIHELQLVAASRGCGVGSFLMRLVESIGVGLGMRLILLTALANNVGAIRFYNKLGFSVDEVSPGPCFSISNSKHEIMSKVLDRKLLRYNCTVIGCRVGFRFKDSLHRHRCTKHGYAWPYPCTQPDCKSPGVIRLYQHVRHLEYKHGIIVEASNLAKKKRKRRSVLIGPRSSRQRKRAAASPAAAENDYLLALKLQETEIRRSGKEESELADPAKLPLPTSDPNTIQTEKLPFTDVAQPSADSGNVEPIDVEQVLATEIGEGALVCGAAPDKVMVASSTLVTTPTTVGGESASLRKRSKSKKKKKKHVDPDWLFALELQVSSCAPELKLTPCNTSCVETGGAKI